LAASFAVGKQINFTGILTRTQVRDEMWRSNALVLSSTFETFGLVLIEALATGLPVVATRCGGPEDIVENGLGVLVDRDDEWQLAQALNLIMRDSHEESSRRQSVVERFSYARVTSQLLKVYDRVLL
jgi:glycosyltransferase involved in cell wall biosynthesis